MIQYNWAVWQNCRLVGYVVAYSETEATRKAQSQFGGNFFLERITLTTISPT
jgi:hypothetical protein